MFTVRANGTQYSMSFEQRNVKRLGREGFEHVVETVCRIYQKDLAAIADGVAQRAPGDEEDTPKALELSMKRALEGVWFDDKENQKAFRGAFWQALRAAIWNEWKPEVVIAGESPLPEPIVDAIPVESEEVKRLRGVVEFSEALHTTNSLLTNSPAESCSACNFHRAQLNQALLNQALRA